MCRRPRLSDVGGPLEGPASWWRAQPPGRLHLVLAATDAGQTQAIHHRPSSSMGGQALGELLRPEHGDVGDDERPADEWPAGSMTALGGDSPIDDGVPSAQRLFASLRAPQHRARGVTTADRHRLSVLQCPAFSCT